MFETMTSPREVLDACLASRRARRQASADEFLLAARFAELSEPTLMANPDASAALHGERLVTLVPGTPRIAEFCVEELSARLDLSPESGHLLVRDALVVTHRLPCMAHLVHELMVEVWAARELVAVTIDLTPEQSLALDAQLARLAPGMSVSRLLEFARARVLELRPEQAADERARLLAGRGVSVTCENPHVAYVDATLDALDGRLLEAQVGRLAAILRQGGSVEEREVRRAQALGLLANPARALQLLQASLLDELPIAMDDREDSRHTGPMPDGCPAVGQPGHTCGAVTVDPEQLLPKTEIIVHLTDATARDGEGITRVEKLGPTLARWVKHLVGHSRVTVRPVLATGVLQPADAYQVPQAMREAVALRNPTCVFPHSRRSSRRADLDHTVAFQHGHPNQPKPRQQTRLDNLGPLSRRQHRAKTHGGWRVEQVQSGVFLWRSPMGYHYLVTPSRTLALDEPPDAPPPPGEPADPVRWAPAHQRDTHPSATPTSSHSLP